MSTLVADGFDDAILGYLDTPGGLVVVYDKHRMIGQLMDQDCMSRGEAVEFLEFNTWGAYPGAGAPVYLERADRGIIDLLVSQREGSDD